MRVLVDTSVWVSHFRQRNETLTHLLGLDQLFGLGCGLVDFTLLASTLLTKSVALWTLDRRLAGLADRFGVAHRPSVAP